MATLTPPEARPIADIERENVLLRKQAEFIRLQLKEVREEVRSIEALAREKGRAPSRETFTLSQFMPRKNGGPSILLQDAIRFYETHDGCPFTEMGCSGDRAGCAGVWIRMGHPCWLLVQRIKDVARAVAPHGDA